jgi:PPOX class probable F420-dependent enzyme
MQPIEQPGGCQDKNGQHSPTPKRLSKSFHWPESGSPCIGLAVANPCDPEKPKRVAGPALKRVRNIERNPIVAILVDRYDEDWTRLGWVMLRGRAEILRAGTEHDRAQELLRSRYRQLAAMQITGDAPHWMARASRCCRTCWSLTISRRGGCRS